MYWAYACAFTASRSEKMENLSSGGPGWQVLGVPGRWAVGQASNPCESSCPKAEKYI